jgi:hypothetical protein
MAAVQQITTDSHTSSVATNGTSTAIAGGAGTGLRTHYRIHRNEMAQQLIRRGDVRRRIL